MRKSKLVALGLGIATAFGCQKEASRPKPTDFATPTASATGSTLTPHSGVTSQSSAETAAPTATATRPDEVIVRPNSASSKQHPFILWLHGLGASGSLLRTVLQLDKLAAQYNFAYAAPDGAVDSKQRKFWNASNVCCDFDHQRVDHVARLSALLESAKAQPDIDPKQLYVIGFSNGGFMAHRLACSGVDLAGFASMAGLGPSPTDACKPAHPLRILEVHGANDVVVRPEGGRLFDDLNLPVFPALRVTVDAWAKRNHCDASAPASKVVDLVPNLPGAETTQLAYSRCAASVELWMIAGAGHMSVNALGVVDAAVQRLLSP
jgi:polyhydroxybutyrate depolymerase